MIFPILTIVLRKDERGRIVAKVKQVTPRGIEEGTNILRGLKPANFAEAKTHVIAKMGNYAKEIIWEIEATEWERPGE